MTSAVDQLSILFEQLFNKPELVTAHADYYQPIKELIAEINAQLGSVTGPYLLDRLPHPTIFKVLHMTTMYYLDLHGNLYLPDNDNPNIAKLVGCFRGTAFEINGRVHPIERRKVKELLSDPRFYVDEKNQVYEPVFRDPTLIGACIGYVDNTGSVRVG